MFSVRLYAAGAFLFVLSACSAMIDTHGDALDPEDLASFEPGKTTYMEVQKKIGSPSAKAVFDSEDWIYLYSQQERIAFFQPKEIARTLTVLRFNQKGILQKIETKTLADGRSIIPTETTTETNQKTLTILDQMINNVGRMATDTPVH